jgi:anthranilate/para-aminobenzoate synthase component II
MASYNFNGEPINAEPRAAEVWVKEQFKLEGWQFHPESFLTEPGIELLRRFLNW